MKAAQIQKFQITNSKVENNKIKKYRHVWK